MNIIRSFVSHRSRITGEKLDLYTQKLAKFSVENFEEIGKLMLNFEKFAIEIGSGYGDTIIHLAKQNPQTLFLACEVYRDALYSIFKRIEENNLQNVRVFSQDARPFLNTFPSGFASASYLLFPDPWPKARHHKRRIINQLFFEEQARILKENSMLFITTDSDSYKQHIAVEILHQKKFKWHAKTESDFTKPPTWWTQTKFQTKALEAGRTCVFLELQKL